MSDEAINREGLRVAIGFPSAVMLVMGGMVGVGVFVNPAVVARSLPDARLILAAWIAGGVMAALGALVYGELAARMPSTGGEYVYLRETYGPLVAFLFGWTLMLVVHTGGMAAVAIIFADNLNVVLGAHLPEGPVVICLLGLLAGLNCLGVRTGNGTQAWLGVLKVAAIVALVGAGLFLAPHAAAAKPPPPIPNPLKAFGAGMIPVVFSYGGWQTTNYVAGEIKDPARNLGRALIVGVIGVMALYVSVNYACLQALGVDALAKTHTPTSDVLGLVAGPLGARIAAGAIALSAVAFLSQSALTGPRVFFAMARDGLFFRQLAAISDGARVPAIAIIATCSWAGVLALTGSYDQILSYVVATNFLFFGVAAAGLFVQRRRDRLSGVHHAGYRAPGHPIATILFVIASALVVASSLWSYPKNSLIGFGLMAIGVGPYLYWRSRQLKELSAAP